MSQGRPTEVPSERRPNSGKPGVPVTVLQPTELWRLGGDDDDCVVGTITSVTVDESGDSYLLDIVLCEVLVVAPDGALRARFGGKGEGPGDFRRPAALCTLKDQSIVVAQIAPGRLTRFDRWGTVLGDHPLPVGEFDGFMMVSSVNTAPDGVVAALNSRSWTADGGVDFHDELVLLDVLGRITATYYERQFNQPADHARFRERDQDGYMPEVWDIGPDGRVYISEYHDRYDIRVCSPNGETERVLSRPHVPVVRTRAEIKAMEDYFANRRSGLKRGNQPLTFEASPNERVIQKIFARDDGSVWVLSGQGAFHPGTGMLAVLDVFDGQGRFVRQVAIPGAGDYDVDGLFIEGNLLFHVTNMLFCSSCGASSGDAGISDVRSENLEVICYRL